MDYTPLMQEIGYVFHDVSLLEKALTHSSFANEGHGGREHYERLEFLGDSVLGFITARYLYGDNKGKSHIRGSIIYHLEFNLGKSFKGIVICIC